MENLGQKALAVVLLVIIISVGAIILDNLQTSVKTSDGATTLSVLNETGSVNNTGYQLLDQIVNNMLMYNPNKRISLEQILCMTTID